MKTHLHSRSWSLKSVTSSDGRRVITLWHRSARGGTFLGREKCSLPTPRRLALNLSVQAGSPPLDNSTARRRRKLSVKFAPERQGSFQPRVRLALPTHPLFAGQLKPQLLNTL
jgi:hypothetical protein